MKWSREAGRGAQGCGDVGGRGGGARDAWRGDDAGSNAGIRGCGDAEKDAGMRGWDARG
jgi:hypothetical protein